MSLSENHELGYVLMSRSILESEVWQMHSDYAKVLISLVCLAAHTDRRYKGFELQRGQCFITYAHISELLGYRRGRGALSRVKRIMAYLKQSGVIRTVKKPRGVLVTLLNYDKYQNPANYERTNERAKKNTKLKPSTNQDRPSINNNENKEKNDKDVGLRDKILKHLSDPRFAIASSEGFLRKIEVSCSYEAITKAWRDWSNGHGIEHPSQFFGRCMEYQAKIEKSEQKSASALSHTQQRHDP
jgi:hypothetical protein